MCYPNGELEEKLQGPKESPHFESTEAEKKFLAAKGSKNGKPLRENLGARSN